MPLIILYVLLKKGNKRFRLCLILWLNLSVLILFMIVRNVVLILYDDFMGGCLGRFCHSKIYIINRVDFHYCFLLLWPSDYSFSSVGSLILLLRISIIFLIGFIFKFSLLLLARYLDLLSLSILSSFYSFWEFNLLFSINTIFFDGEWVWE